MLNISAPPAARRGRATSAPTTPIQARAIGATPNFTSSTNSPFVTSASNKITPLRSAAVIIPREPNLSDLTSYYPRAHPFSDAIADPHGGFRHWSNGELAAGSPWNTPQRQRRASGQSGVSPSVSTRLHLILNKRVSTVCFLAIVTSVTQTSASHTVLALAPRPIHTRLYPQKLSGCELCAVRYCTSRHCLVAAVSIPSPSP